MSPLSFSAHLDMHLSSTSVLPFFNINHLNDTVLVFLYILVLTYYFSVALAYSISLLIKHRRCVPLSGATLRHRANKTERRA